MWRLAGRGTDEFAQNQYAISLVVRYLVDGDSRRFPDGSRVSSADLCCVEGLYLGDAVTAE